ncbi:hypothetical protein FUAX_37110 [Fulvitalea axinellae]|uniref:Phage holin family protein n=1 Tax=Fulvitalea axinellae TaxID=1182444 RepID=A0AAU9CGH6_9BACT|nr:hypothetical protein FUAX_37110 [Fulvitalea axinellae]
MKEKIAKWLRLEELAENLIGYAEARIELTKVRMQEQACKLVANFAVTLIIALAFTFFAGLASFTTGLFLGQLLDNTALGFFILSVISALIVAVLYYYRKSLIQSTMDKVFEVMNEKEEDQNDNKDKTAE